jgi:hypothetical protein
LRGCCCPPAAVLLLLRAAESSRRRVASVARSRRALGSRRRKMCEGTEGHRSAVVASVLRPLAFFFFAFFALFLFFCCGRRVAAGAARIRWSCHLVGFGTAVRVQAACTRQTGCPKAAATGRRADAIIIFWGRRRRGPSRPRTFRGQVGRLFPAGRPSPDAAVLRDSESVHNHSY